ncbi:hypothetical protein C3L33_09138, partial [Rhododendron williamsianum]
MEMKLEGNFNLEDGNSLLTPKHPLTLKRAKVEALKKRVNEEKAKYLNSIRVTRAMTLNNLRTSLPHVFQALMGFSSAYAQSLEAILSRPEPVDCDAEFSPIRERTTPTINTGDPHSVKVPPLHLWRPPSTPGMTEVVTEGGGAAFKVVVAGGDSGHQWWWSSFDFEWVL